MLSALALLADTTPAAAPKSQASDVVCHKEYQLGSNIPTKVCRSRSEDEANRAESRMNLEHMQAQSAPPNGH
jgi:hypothetical protein